MEPTSATAPTQAIESHRASAAPPRRAGLRLQLVLALFALTVLAFVPLFLAVASLTRHTLHAAREDAARALGRAVAGRLASDVSKGASDALLRDVAHVSLDGEPVRPAREGREGVVAIRIAPGSGRTTIEVGSEAALAALRGLAPAAADGGERTVRAIAPGVGPLLAVEVSPTPAGATVQVALRVGDQASRAAPLLRLVAFYTAAFALVLVVIAYLLLGRLIVRPIGQLVTATRRIVDPPASGSIRPPRAHELEVSGAAEVVELGQAIARTTGRLVEREQALAAKVEQLETARADLLAARDAIVRSERLASVGRLSAGLAHEVGNPIAALLGLEEVLLTGELDPESRDLVERMKRETERVHRIMRDLLDFARAGQEPRASEADASASIAEVVGEVVALVQPQGAMRRIVLEAEVAPALRPARIAADKLQQVLLNLVLNAADALHEGGRDGHGRIVVRARPGDAQTLRVEVEDDGPGVPDEVRASLFEPFVTTKEVGKGTGLGLAVCRGLIEAAGGRIALDDAGSSGGARFVLVLPTIDAPPRPRSVAPPSFSA